MVITTSTHEQHLGCDDWNGLLVDQQPIVDPGFRDFILRCGRFCQAANDNYDGNFLKRHGKPLNPEDELLRSIGVLRSHDLREYVVVAYLTTSAGFFSGKTDWLGYVVATTDEATERLRRREVYIVWRGTKTLRDWVNHVTGVKREALDDDDGSKVHSGWLSMYDHGGAEDSPKRQVVRALEKYKGEPYPVSVVVTGHSLGGALATLAAVDIVQSSVVHSVTTRFVGIVFACPQVGNRGYKARLESNKKQLKILHFKSSCDIVPWQPDYRLTFYVPIHTRKLVLKSCSPRDIFEFVKRHELEEMLRRISEPK